MVKPRCPAKTVVKGAVVYCDWHENHDGMHIGTERVSVRWWDNDDDDRNADDHQPSLDAIGGL